MQDNFYTVILNIIMKFERGKDLKITTREKNKCNMLCTQGETVRHEK